MAVNPFGILLPDLAHESRLVEVSVAEVKARYLDFSIDYYFVDACLNFIFSGIPVESLEEIGWWTRWL